MEDIEAIALLQDPVRRRLYEYVAARDHEIGRNEAAEAAGVGRTLAAFHLDKLVAAGLLETASRRLTGRSGPGAGRPAKLYRRSGAERGVSLPARDYRTAAGLLAEAAETAGLDDELRAAARRRGRALRAEPPPRAWRRSRRCWPSAATSPARTRTGRCGCATAPSTRCPNGSRPWCAE
ncbi:transcriptional regulator [Actinomadura yumaensis]|uniref:transcriptional regulator n=1 Tax=Actinomadura yumaensis TaxID=111807 RepID=UPI003605BAD4